MKLTQPFILLLISVFVFSFSYEANAQCLVSNKRTGKLSIKNFRPNGKCGRGAVNLTEFVANTATPGQQGAPGPQGAQGPQGVAGPKGEPAVIKVTSGFASDSNEWSGTFAKVRDIGNFTKDSDTSLIKLTISAHSTTVNDASGTAFCSYTPRINGASASGDNTNTFDASESGTVTIGASFLPGNQIQNSQFTSVAYFNNLSAGAMDIDLWGRSISAANCSLNDGNFRILWTAEEIEPNL
jgi:hypothetical protein